MSKPKNTFETLRRVIRESNAEPADVVIISGGDETHYLEESQWLKVNFEQEIRIDRNTHMRSGEKHAHVHDRKGNEMYALTHDGKPSHNSKPFRLDQKQADALRKKGFTIKPNNIVEAVLIGGNKMIILG